MFVALGGPRRCVAYGVDGKNDVTGSQQAGNITNFLKIGSASTAAHADVLMFLL